MKDDRSVPPARRKSARTALTIAHPSAAGIDIGSTSHVARRTSHFVAVPDDRDDQPVREFPSFTVDLQALADWLAACHVDIVAMQSTGVYWIPLFELLESRGFTVLLVNARHVKNVSGRKSDVLDCQWLQQLVSYGLLRGAFRPAEQVAVLRALTRQRTMLLRTQARHVQHMQKALTQVNVQLANVIADIVGVTAQLILRAIAASERDGQSLQGNWRAEHLFALRQALAGFDFIGTRVVECDREIEAQLGRLQTHDRVPEKSRKHGHTRNAPKFDQRDRRGNVPSSGSWPLRELVGAVSGYSNHRWQGHERQDAAQRQPCSAGAEVGGCGAASEQVSARCVLQTVVRTHGQTQGHHRCRTQARSLDLHHAHQRRGVRRSGPGVLRGALAGTRAPPIGATCPADWHDPCCQRAAGMKHQCVSVYAGVS